MAHFCLNDKLTSHGTDISTTNRTVLVQLSITRKTDKTVKIYCKVSGISFGGAYIHWYRQRPGEAPEWILYFKTQAEKSNFDQDKFHVDKTTEKSTCTLRVEKLTYNDMGTYYCAYWDRTVLEIFGSGTKLVVSNIQAKHSTNMQLLPHSDEQAGKVSYMCLIEDFYPDVIKVTWEDDNKNAEKNGVHEEIWPSDDNNSSYSMSSWLTNYRCKYQHEAREGFLPIESPGIYYIIKTSSIYIFRESTLSLQQSNKMYCF
uniref:Ig-like domain-containing protein n=1 Tax=Chelydra serpentina TaxID=8475 RepID=A0A8C3TL93_CHESE